MQSSRFRKGFAPRRPPRPPTTRSYRPRAVTTFGRGGWMAAATRTEERLRRRTARIGVIGLGYVGLPLAVEFAKAGFRVTGFEINAKRVATLNRGVSYIQDVPTDEVRALVRDGRLRATLDFGQLARVDAIAT